MAEENPKKKAGKKKKPRGQAVAYASTNPRAKPQEANPKKKKKKRRRARNPSEPFSFTRSIVGPAAGGGGVGLISMGVDRLNQSKGVQTAIFGVGAMAGAIGLHWLSPSASKGAIGAWTSEMLTRVKDLWDQSSIESSTKKDATPSKGMTGFPMMMTGAARPAGLPAPPAAYRPPTNGPAASAAIERNARAEAAQASLRDLAQPSRQGAPPTLAYLGLR